MPAQSDNRLKGSETRLESWKQIAAHLNRHITTVRRWERHEGLPVHRHIHTALSSIYAYASELDAWMEARQPESSLRLATATKSAPVPFHRLGAPPPMLNGLERGRVSLQGREEEIQTLRNLWQTVSTGRQQVAFIAGAAGQGKSRLVLEFAHMVAPQARVLTGSWEREALVPFAPFVAVLQWILKTVDPTILNDIFRQVAGCRELAQLVPELANRVSCDPLAAPLSIESRRFFMFDSFARLIVALSHDYPVLLTFEDLHWADRGSLLFLRHLLRSSKESAICIVATYREHETGIDSCFEEQRRELQREMEATTICLGGLASLEVCQLVDLWTTNTASHCIRDWIVAITEGNPFFVVAILTHLEKSNGFSGDPPSRDAALPSEVRAFIRSLLAGLSTRCRQILTVCSVVGREFSLHLLKHLLDIPEDEMLDSLEEALLAGLVNEISGQPGQFCFTHALTSEIVYSNTMVARRVLLHHRIGKALERQSIPDTLPLEKLAYHFTEGAFYDKEKAIDYATRAGNRAHSNLAMEQAARYYGMALRTMRLLPSGSILDSKQAELQTLSGRSWLQAGHWAYARAAFIAALSLLDPADLVKHCELLLHTAEACFWLMDVPSLRRFAGEAESIADRIGRSDLWGEARAWMASALVADGDVLGGIALDRETLASAGGIRSFGMARIPLTLYWAGKTAEAVSRAVEAVDGARAASDPAFLLYALQHLGICLTGAGRIDEALAAFEDACALGRRCGATSLLARATSMSIAPLFSMGEFARAMNRAYEARELARRVSFDPPFVSAGIDLVLIYARTYNAGKAEPLVVELQQGIDKAGGWHAWKWKMRLAQARAELALAKGEWNDAVTFADQVIEQSKWRYRPKYEALALTVRARARHELGIRKALDDARAAVTIARRIADPVLLAESLSIVVQQHGTNELLTETRNVTDSLFLGVTDVSLRRSFVARLGEVGGRPGRQNIHAVVGQ
jgi:tetratricopeptide (TPR) repeat protein